MNALRRAAVAAMLVILAGCATYSDLRDRPADYSADTTKTPQAYAECVLPKWIESNAGAHIIADGDSRVIVAPVGGGTPTAVAATLTASPTAAGSHVEMKHMPALNKFTDQWGQARSCL